MSRQSAKRALKARRKLNRQQARRRDRGKCKKLLQSVIGGLNHVLQKFKTGTKQSRENYGNVCPHFFRGCSDFNNLRILVGSDLHRFSTLSKEDVMDKDWQDILSEDDDYLRWYAETQGERWEEDHQADE